MLGIIYAHNQSSMQLRPSNRVISLFCPNNRWIIAQIVLVWSDEVDFETEVGLIIVLRQHLTRKFGEILQNKGHYAVQGHSRSLILVPIESSFTTSY